MVPTCLNGLWFDSIPGFSKQVHRLEQVNRKNILLPSFFSIQQINQSQLSILCLQISNDSSICWLNMGREVWGEENKSNVRYVILSPFMSTGIVQQHCHMNPLLPKLFVQVLHGLCKDLSSHPHLLIVEVPEAQLQTHLLLEASRFCC